MKFSVNKNVFQTLHINSLGSLCITFLIAATKNMSEEKLEEEMIHFGSQFEGTIRHSGKT